MHFVSKRIFLKNQFLRFKLVNESVIKISFIQRLCISTIVQKQVIFKQITICRKIKQENLQLNEIIDLKHKERNPFISVLSAIQEAAGLQYSKSTLNTRFSYGSPSLSIGAPQSSKTRKRNVKDPFKVKSKPSIADRGAETRQLDVATSYRGSLT